MLQAALFFFLFSLFVSGCEPGETQGVDVTEGVWAAAAGPDSFLFELTGTPPDSLSGTVHVMRDGKMVSQLAITRATYRAPALEVFIQSTNATYRGRVDATRRRVEGGLSYGGSPGPEMDLRWSDPADFPGYTARALAAPYEYVQPPDGIDGWPTATPEDVDVDRGALEATVDAIARGDAGLIHSIGVVRRGKLILDEYFHGYQPGDLHRLASVTKSVSSLLVGAAVDRGLIAGPDQPLLDLLGPWADAAGPGWTGETLGHLLTMTMGLDWSVDELETIHGTGPDFFEEVLRRHVVAEPGTKWAYASADVDLLAAVLHGATGQHAEAFAATVLFAPLGITEYDWVAGKVDGYALMDGSLRLRPRDLAKVGAMVAARGRWDGARVISAEWIDESTRTHVETGEPPVLGGYGYLWWTGELPIGGEARRIVLANGMGSQFVLIVPSLDVVVVTTGGNDDNGRHLDIGGVLSETLFRPGGILQ